MYNTEISYFFTCSSLHKILINSDCVASNVRMIGLYCTGSGAEGDFRGLKTGNFVL